MSPNGCHPAQHLSYSCLPVLGVERSPTGIPVARLAMLGDRAYGGDAMTMPADKERGAFRAAVERLGTPTAPLGGLTTRKAT